MKTKLLSLMVACLAGGLFSAGAQPAPGNVDTNTPPANQTAPAEQPMPPPPDAGNGPDAGGPPPMPDVAPAEDNAVPQEGDTNQESGPMIVSPSKTAPAEPEDFQSQYLPPDRVGTNVNDLDLNFNRAPLDRVLNYLSDAAGFIIIQDTHISSSAQVTVSGKHLTRDEAVDILNDVLNRNGYAAIRDGRTLTIVDKTDAKTREIPVKSGNNPDAIPKNAEIVTQIIPVRFVEARQLVSDLSSFVSPQATVVANEAGNSIVITDTQENIHHLAEIIKAVDDSAEAETEIRVFKLEHANPNDVATELTSVFPSSSSGNTTQSPIRFGGGGGGPGGFFRQMMAGAAGGGGDSSNDRIKKATQVSAVADARIQAVIVTAPKDLMEQIASMVKDLDVTSDRDQDVYVYKMNNADPQQVASELQTMFQSSTARNTTGNNQNSALQQRQQNNNSTTGSSSSGTSGFGTMGGGGGGGRAGGGGGF
jgi:type II secretory pathway component GspD/PulD (secretin)